MMQNFKRCTSAKFTIRSEIENKKKKKKKTILSLKLLDQLTNFYFSFYKNTYQIKLYNFKSNKLNSKSQTQLVEV